MVKKLFKNIGVMLLIIWMSQNHAFAQNTAEFEPKNPADATFRNRCDNAKNLKFPECADSPSECGSEPFARGAPGSGNNTYRYPFNCIFLREPLGGEPGYDLYKATPIDNPDGITETKYTLWRGKALAPNESGPFQAVLTFEKGKELQGPFGLLYNYLGLVYKFLSGLIIAFVILISIVGGIRMTTSAGNQEAFGAGRKMIIKVLIGMVIWFTASVILYTINPTFFRF